MLKQTIRKYIEVDYEVYFLMIFLISGIGVLDKLKKEKKEIENSSNSDENHLGVSFYAPKCCYGREPEIVAHGFLSKLDPRGCCLVLSSCSIFWSK